MEANKRIKKFISKIIIDSSSECWIWIGSKSASGYGVFFDEGRLYGAHVYSWRLHNGIDIPKGMYICHTCDNKACVNPSHLFLGTPSDNISNREERIKYDKRTSSVVKLNFEKANEIRLLNATGKWTRKALANEYGVSTSTIKNIVLGHKWRN